MQQLLSDATKYIVRRNQKKIWLKAVLCLACVVVFCTVYALILPAITLEETTYCGYEEHCHDSNCYADDGSLICGQEEHIHSLSCYSDPSADVEDAGVWEKTLPNALTGEWREDVLAAAKSQIGYSESSENYRVVNENETKGYTRYGAWYGDSYAELCDDWSAMFVSFCLNYADIPETVFPRDASCSSWIHNLNENYGLYHDAADYVPSEGDIIFFDTNGDRLADHAGIVTESEESQIKTIEGDLDNCVRNSTYPLNDGRIYGYGELPDNSIEANTFSVNALASDETSQGILDNSSISFETVWDTSANLITGFTVKIDNVAKNKTHLLQVSDDGGTSWTTIASVKQNVASISIVCSDVIQSSVPLNRKYQVYDSDNKKYVGSFNIYDLLESVKTGFVNWLNNSYVQEFGGTALPQTTEELYQTFALYDSLPSLTVMARKDGDNYFLDAVTDGEGNYTYYWQYLDENGVWQQLTEETGATINAGAIEVLLSGGKNIRCKMYEDGVIRAVSEELFVNPLREKYDQAIEEINQGLNLGDLAINGTTFTDYFYYGNVASDSRVPFNDAASYADYLAKTYLDAGGGEAGLSAVQTVWNQYLYDIYDPSFDGEQTNSGDGELSWPKDNNGSFHSDTVPKVIDLNYDFLEEGVDYSNFVTGLNKTATTAAAGDANAEREYDVDITADVQAKARGPVALVFQIQTSWQMFDMLHANALKGEGSTQVGANASNTEIANLYAIKQALLRFVDYMETKYPGNNVVLGITEVQHGKSHSMFEGTDSNGSTLYVTNDYDALREGLLGWDTFGNCEHVHYDTNKLEAAVKNLASNLSTWEDFYGQKIEYDDIQKVAIILGGGTENSASDNGYACTLPWATFSSNKINSVYGIRTNTGSPLNAGGVMSWIDYSKNNTGEPFNDSVGTSFTKKYVASSEDALFYRLVQIAEQEMNKNGIEVTAEDKYVDDVTVTDTVSAEFDIDTDEPVYARIYSEDGTLEQETQLSLEDLTITNNEDGTTTVTYNFRTIYNTKKAVLHFGVKAKEDYLGSNNVFTNVGTPNLVYTHNKIDSSGQPTGESQTYDVLCTDTPQVNVPIRFTTVDGEKTEILLGDSTDLKDLSEKIVENAQDLVDNYEQINGVLSYVWVMPDGTEIEAGSVNVANGSIGSSTFPDRSQAFRPEEAGQYQATLKVTFTPNTVDSSNENFCDEITKIPVNPLTNEGNVWIRAVDRDSPTQYIVRKEWEPSPPEDITEISFRLLADGVPVVDSNGEQLIYTISADNDWETVITDLPSTKTVDGNEVIIQYSVEEISVPNGYEESYRTDMQTETQYAAQTVFRVTPAKDANDANLVQITYTYNGQTYMEEFTVSGLKKDSLYGFTARNLPLDENGNPYPVSDVTVQAYKKENNGNLNNKDIGTYSLETDISVYVSGSTSTEVSVIKNSLLGYELPETGGTGTMLYTIGGLLLIASSLLYGYRLRRRRERRVKR